MTHLPIDWSNRYPSPESLLSDDERFMVEALKCAWKAFDAGEVPIGAICVTDDGQLSSSREFLGRIISRAHNQVELLQDATAHAEMLALGAATQQVGGWRLQGITLYTTVEPCVMCTGALILSRITRVVWGARDLRHGGCGSFIDIFEKPHPIHTPQQTQFVLEEWCKRPLQLFFQKRRKEVE